ncbi:MFS transporter [Gordonia sp. CPCC 206044]|uniref:MFS transporter n=1 Tax=Gordonia sp. CPCC 206044 TaxID=3140793 RepID=UPI003AF3C09D
MTSRALPSTPPTLRRRRLWPTLAVLTAATMWTVTGEMLPSGVLPAMSRDLGVAESTVGVLVSAWAITIAVVGIPLVRATLRIPRAILLTGALAVTAVANMATAFAPGFAMALVARLIAAGAHGLFWALVVVYVASIVEPERLGRSLAIVLSGPTVATLLGLPAGAFLADVIGWRAVFAGVAVLLAATAVALWLILPHTDPETGAPQTSGTWDRSAPAVLVAVAGGGLVLVGHFAAFTYVAVLITGLGGLDTASIPLLLLIFGIAGGFGVALSGKASDRYPSGSVVGAAALLAAGLAALRIGADDTAVFTAGIALWGMAIGAFPPILQAHVLRLSTPRFRPLAGSIVITVLNLGIAGGATVGGLILARSQSTLVLTALAAALAGVVVLAMATGREWHRGRE